MKKYDTSRALVHEKIILITMPASSVARYLVLAVGVRGRRWRFGLLLGSSHDHVFASHCDAASGSRCCFADCAEGELVAVTLYSDAMLHGRSGFPTSLTSTPSAYGALDCVFCCSDSKLT